MNYNDADVDVDVDVGDGDGIDDDFIQADCNAEAVFHEDFF